MIPIRGDILPGTLKVGLKVQSINLSPINAAEDRMWEFMHYLKQALELLDDKDRENMIFNVYSSLDPYLPSGSFDGDGDDDPDNTGMRV